MTRNLMEVHNGPDKSDLLRAVTNPDKHIHVSFDTRDEPIQAHIDVVEEVGVEGIGFALRGHLTSGHLRGANFAGTYDVSTRTGRLLVEAYAGRGICRGAARFER
jgi:hypothetical protein